MRLFRRHILSILSYRLRKGNVKIDFFPVQWYIVQYRKYEKEVSSMDYQALAELLFPDVNDTPESLEARFPQRDLPEGAVVTRMAPSPTGFVHLGNLV